MPDVSFETLCSSGFGPHNGVRVPRTAMETFQRSLRPLDYGVGAPSCPSLSQSTRYPSPSHLSPSQSQNSVPRTDRAGLDPACFSLPPQTLRSRETFLTFRPPTISFNWVASDNETPSLNLLTLPLAINHPRETTVSRLRFLGSVGGP